MEVVSVKLMYLCDVLHRLSKHFLIITFDRCCLTYQKVKVKVMR